MNINPKTIVEAAAMVRRSRKLKTALKEWFGLEHRPDPEISNFEDWVCRRLSQMAEEIRDEGIAAIPGFLVRALELHVIGDPLAIKEAKRAERNHCGSGYSVDVCCCVEEGSIFTSVSVTAKKNFAKGMAQSIKNTFQNAGYDVDLIDEGDGTEVVIVAVMPFSTYVEKL